MKKKNYLYSKWSCGALDFMGSKREKNMLLNA
jgi:hypothetical protein